MTATSGAEDPYPRRRDTVAAFLAARSATLGELYLYACGVLRDRRPEGWEHLVAHVGRELMNRLADHLEAVPLQDPDAPGSPTRPTAIGERLRQASTADEATLRATVDELVDEIAQGSDAIRQRAVALVRQAEQGIGVDAGSTDAWVRAWRELQQRFADWAHLRGPAAPPIPADDLERSWRELTDLLATRIAHEPFFSSMDELLELARQPEPDRETARAALARLRPGTRHRFYAELQDPAWVGLLAAEQAFLSPPAAIRDGEAIRFPDWPEGLVLLAFAPSVPEDVARAAAAVPASDNARAAHLLASVAAELPAELAADQGLVSRVKQDLGGAARLLDIAEPVGRLAARLAAAGRNRKAIELLKALLRIEIQTTPSGVDLLPDWRHGRFRHDEYLVDRSARGMLDAVVAGDAQLTVRELIRVLRHAQRELATQDSTRWRDEVAGTRSPYGDDPRHLILELLRDSSRVLAARSAEEREWVLQALESQDSEIFERLRLYLLGVLPGEAERRAAALADPDVLYSRERLAEVYAILPVAYAEADAPGRADLLARINEGPAPERLGLPATERGAIPSDEIDRWQDEWRQRLLSAIEDLLDADARQRLQALRERRGTIQRPGYSGVESRSWIGPTSPRTGAQLTSMEHDEVVALLRQFRAEQHFASPSPEGLGRELESAVKNDPNGWKWISGRLNEVPPLYVRCWLSGLESALRAGNAVTESDQLLDAISWVLDQQGDFDAQGEALEEDADYYGAQIAAARLLTSLLSAGAFELGARARVWELVERLSVHRDPTPEREAQPLQLSFSALRPQGALAVVRYLQWLDRVLPADERPGRRGFDAAPETQAPLLRLATEDPSRAVRAALAPELPVLALLDDEWLGAWIAGFVDPDGDELARVAWSAYLRYSSLWGKLTILLASAYLRAVGALAHEGGDDRDRRELAEHVAVIWRDLPDTVPGLLDELIAAGTDDDRARVVGLLGRALHQEGPGDYSPSNEDLNRHRALWDARLADEPGPAELREFGWWWSSGRFRTRGDLTRLTQTIRAAGGRIGDIRDVVQMVREVRDGEDMAESVLELLEAIADARTAQSQFLPEELLADLLQPSLTEGSLRERGIALVHAFGEQGYHTLRSLLD